MAVIPVGGATSSATTSVSNRTLTIPAVQDGDRAFLVYAHGTAQAATPDGWTLLRAANEGSEYAELFTRTLVAADSGTSVQVSVGTAQRQSASLAIYRGVTNATATHSSGSALNYPLPTLVAPAGGAVAITAIAERGTNASTVFGAPSGYVPRPDSTSYGTGTGACSTGIADRLGDVIASGGTVGSGSWTADAANAAVVFTIALVPAPTTALSGTLSLAPTSGYAPLAVTATATFTGGTGSAKEYLFTWGDGTSTGWQSSATASHTYTVADSYTVAAGKPVTVDCRNV